MILVHEKASLKIGDVTAYLAVWAIGIILAVPVHGQHSRVTYLIIEHTDQLLIYNAYQQRITQQERALFAPFVPMKVLDDHATLTDNFTTCIEVEIDKAVFYLVKGERSLLLGSTQLGLNRFYHGVILIEDTIKLLQEHTVLLSPNHSKRSVLPKGKTIVRYFREGVLTYAKVLGVRAQFGWFELSNKNSYVIMKTVPAKQSLNRRLYDQMQRRIVQKIDETNLVLKNLFSFFNRETKEKKILPHWLLKINDAHVVCRLEPAMYAQYYFESTKYLAQELDNIVLGTGYSVFLTSDEIDIHQK